MATDYAGKEKEFVASLAADTGRDLDGWMQAITAAKLDHRNDIIDWLRQNGFTFANASWLERIHHNGGRLIYGDDEPKAPPVVKSAAVSVPNVAVAEPRVVVPFPSVRERDAVTAPPKLAVVAPAAVAPPALVFEPAVTELLLNAKGLRPLALVALQEIVKAIPGAQLAADGPLIVIAAPKRFLALLPNAKALRFYGDFDRAGDDRVERAEAAIKTPDKRPPPFPAVVALADARLVDDAFTALVHQAHTRAHA